MKFYILFLLHTSATTPVTGIQKREISCWYLCSIIPLHTALSTAFSCNDALVVNTSYWLYDDASASFCPIYLSWVHVIRDFTVPFLACLYCKCLPSWQPSWTESPLKSTQRKCSNFALLLHKQQSCAGPLVCLHAAEDHALGTFYTTVVFYHKKKKHHFRLFRVLEKWEQFFFPPHFCVSSLPLLNTCYDEKCRLFSHN